MAANDERLLFPSWASFKDGWQRDLGFDPSRNPYEPGRFLFRGHGSTTWKLTTHLDRRFKRHLADVSPQEISEQLLRQFRIALEGIDLPDAVIQDPRRLNALGQHYGLPTRYLDWSESPYVAAFFAYWNRFSHPPEGGKEAELGPDFGDEGVIWVIDSQHRIWASEYGVEVVRLSSTGNLRLRHQAGRFTVTHATKPSLEEYVKWRDAQGQDVRGALRRWCLPIQEWESALLELESMGIHPGTIFPGIEGAAQLALFRTVVRLDLWRKV